MELAPALSRREPEPERRVDPDGAVGAGRPDGLEGGFTPLAEPVERMRLAAAANGQSAAFFPLTFLMMALPLANAFNLAAALKLFVALTGTWLWLSEIGSGGSPLSSVRRLWVLLDDGPMVLFPLVAMLWRWALFAIERMRDPA